MVSSQMALGVTGGLIGTGLSFWMERRIGNALFQQVKQQAMKNHTLLPESHRYVALVRHVGSRIAQVASQTDSEGSCRHMKNLKWEFVVVESNQVNAFVVPGGKVVVFSGLIRLMKSVDELAAVLAHEVAHVVARHSAERITELGILATARFLVDVLFGVPLPLGIGDLLFTLPHSRRAETEADVIGVRLMARACFDPSAAPSMLSRLDHLEQESARRGQVPALLRTHPVTSERMDRVRRELPDAAILFEDQECWRRRGLRQHLR